MIIEAIAALIVGAAILVLVLEPLIRVEAPAPVVIDPEESDESPRGQALTALREIEFDKATGKLSDADYDALKGRYTRIAVDAMRAEDLATAPVATGDVEAQVAARVAAIRSGAATQSCPIHGPRPESDALFCSDCGLPLNASVCRRCQAPVTRGSRFCEQCGEPVSA